MSWWTKPNENRGTTPATGRSVYEELAERRRVEEPDDDAGWTPIGELDLRSSQMTRAPLDWHDLQQGGCWIPLDRFQPRI